MKHTPGPWVTRSAPYGWDIFNERTAVWIGSTTAPLGKDSPFYPSKEQTDANAILMSEAPEMAAEIVSLRRALVDALLTFDISERTRFYMEYADVIARARADLTAKISQSAIDSQAVSA